MHEWFLKQKTQQLSSLGLLIYFNKVLPFGKDLGWESIATYQDHRMAMAFAPLALLIPIIIEDAEVVSKSFPSFWEDLKSIGFQIETV